MSETSRELSEAMARFLPREARWSYFQDGRGPMFVWNTEPIKSMYGSSVDGMFESCVFVPVGRGSRSGKATKWDELDGSRSAHTLRRDAKARALRLFLAWRETGKVEL